MESKDSCITPERCQKKHAFDEQQAEPRAAGGGILEGACRSVPRAVWLARPPEAAAAAHGEVQLARLAGWACRLQLAGCGCWLHDARYDIYRVRAVGLGEKSD